jgi:hypothetical protein
MGSCWKKENATNEIEESYMLEYAKIRNYDTILGFDRRKMDDELYNLLVLSKIKSGDVYVEKNNKSTIWEKIR